MIQSRSVTHMYDGLSTLAPKSTMPSIPYAPLGGLGAWEYVRLTTVVKAVPLERGPSL